MTAKPSDSASWTEFGTGLSPSCQIVRAWRAASAGVNPDKSGTLGSGKLKLRRSHAKSVRAFAPGCDCDALLS